MTKRVVKAKSRKNDPSVRTDEQKVEGIEMSQFRDTVFSDTVPIDEVVVADEHFKEEKLEQFEPVFQEKQSIHHDQIEYSKLLSNTLRKIADEYSGVKIDNENKDTIIHRFSEEFKNWIKNGSVKWPFLSEGDWNITFGIVNGKFKVSFTNNVKAFFAGKVNGQGQPWS